ncbi:MAG: 30S ribosomal protein S17 [Candidatus Scalinduaceae bacterium]
MDRRKTVIGVVTSNKMLKTITVKSEKLVKHPKYGKFVRRVTTYKAHDEENKVSIDDKVEIAETRPLSKTKRWRLVRIVK